MAVNPPASGDAQSGASEDRNEADAAGGVPRVEQGHLPAASARVYDYWLGGKDNFAADRQVAERVAQLVPEIPGAARANRRFLARAVTHLARRGVTQFIDIGSGMPTSPNVHQVAQAVNPNCRVVYVDHDPMVAVHGRALLVEDRRTVVVEADARHPRDLVTDPLVVGHLDWTRPVAVLMVALLHFLTDTDDPAATVTAFRDAMTPGSFLVISHAVPGPIEHSQAVEEARRVYSALAVPFTPRTPEQVVGFFDGFELLPPGLVRVNAWRAPGEPDPWAKSGRAGRPRWEHPLRVVAGIGRRPADTTRPVPAGPGLGAG